MRKTILVFVLMLAATSLLAAQTRQKITVGINQQKTVVKNKLTVKFVSLIEDSRCPTDTRCIQAGNARIRVTLAKPKGAAQTFELNTGERPQTVFFAGYEIKLTELNPAPATNIRINRNGYTATFVVSKAR